MFASIFTFEIKRWVRSVSSYIYFFILFALAFLIALTLGGTFPGVLVSTGGEKIHANAPGLIDSFFSGFDNYIGVIIIVAVIGNAVLRDFKENTYSLIYTTPVSKFNYLFGRFSATLVVCLIILTAPAFGMMAAYATPWVNADKIGAFMLSPYIQTYWQTIIPNVLLEGAIFFAVSLIVRDIFGIWLSLIIFYVAIGISNSFFSSLDHETLSALVDPLGSHAKRVISKYWTADQKNHLMYAMQGLLLLNRVIWVGISFVLLAIGYKFFSFTSSPRKLFFNKPKIADNPKHVFAKSEFNKDALPKAAMHFGTMPYLKSLWQLSVNECKTILRNVYFRIILVFGLAFLLLISLQIGKIYETATLPVTYEMVEYLGGSFGIIITILTIMFAGELVWRSRDYRMSNILDALPVPNWVYYISKIVGLWFIEILLLLIVMIAGIIVQTFKGYTHYEVLLYIQYLFEYKLIDFLLLGVLAVFVQTLVSNKYIGYFIMVLFYIWNTFFAGTVLKHPLFVFASDPGVEYSAMNGFGHVAYPFFIFKLYWGALALCLAVLSSILWARGSEASLRIRFANGRLKAARPAWIVIVAGLIVFITCGSFIYYNTNVENVFHTNFQQEELQAKYEKQYKKFENIPQPKIISVKLNVDIFPYTRSLKASGIFVIKNKSAQPIDSVHIILPASVKIESLSFSTGASLALNDPDLGYIGYRIYKLSKPMQPGDSINLSFSLEMIPHGFKEYFTGLNTPLYNGTFVNNEEFLPYIGYSKALELSDNNERKKHGLGYRRTENPINDTAAYAVNAFMQDADFIDFDATVSTVPDQIAIAPGYLQKEWTENGRRYFHYKMDSKILNFYSFLSARYEIKKEMWNNVNLEIYYNKGHEYNLDRMFNGMKKALQYYTTNFTPYQHKQLRILEFPRYQTFAQSFPNTIPFSEGIGFIADVDDSDKETVDYPFYVTAHEVAHQWFAHQVVGADVQGSNMLSETLAQYGAIMVMEKEFGEDKINKFLHIEMDKYLTLRSAESEKENPLAYVDAGQAYILYQKGGIVMHALGKYIGEDSLNHALKRFIEKYRFQGPPYPTTLDLLAELRLSTPDSLQYFITDAFQRITLYNNKITEAHSTKTANGQYKVDFKVNTQKIYADSAGVEKPAPSDDYIEVGVYGKKHALLQLNRYKLKGGETSLSITVNQEPEKVVIDPRELLIDKDLKDNEMRLDKDNGVAKK